MPRPKKTKKTQEEIAIENQIKALKQQLAIEKSKRQNRSQNQSQNQNRSQRQNQSTVKKPAKEIIKNDFRDVISAEIPGIEESGKPDYERISDTPRNNFHNASLRYKVKIFKSNDIESYLNKISKWVKTRVVTGWKKI